MPNSGEVIYEALKMNRKLGTVKKMTNYEALKMPGMLGEFIRCALSKDGGVYCDCCDMWKKCGVKREENQRGCDFDWCKYFRHSDEYTLRKMARLLSTIFYNMCDYCPVGDYDEICDGDEYGCAEAFEEWLSEENWLIEPLLKTTPLGFYHEQ